jgi:hypothetical protein
MSELIRIPVPGSDVQIAAVMHNGEPVFIPKHICDSFGIPWRAQHERLTSPSAEHWSTMRKIHTVAADGKVRELICINQQTLIVWLTTMPPTLIGDPAVRQKLIEFQREAYRAVVDYFTKGYAINPNIVPIEKQAEVLAILKTASPNNPLLDMKINMLASRVMGDVAVIPDDQRPLYATQFLQEKGLGRKKVNSLNGIFGYRVKNRYRHERGCDPGEGWYDGADGRPHPCAVYIEADRPIMAAVYSEFVQEGRL